MSDLDPQVGVKKVATSDTDLVVEWSDGHVSRFLSLWLDNRKMTTSHHTKQREEKQLWDHTFLPRLPRYDYQALMDDDSALLSCLLSLTSQGLTLVENVPCCVDTLRTFASRVGPIKQTHYGDDFEVYTKVNPNNLAYTSAGLGLHLDLPYYSYMPGTQLLHCIRQHRGSAYRLITAIDSRWRVAGH